MKDKDFFVDNPKEIKKIQNEEWFDEILKNEVAQKISKQQISTLKLEAFLESKNFFGRNIFPYVVYKMGKDKLYVVKDIVADLLNTIETEEYKNFGKNLRLKVSYNNFDSFSKKQIDFLSENFMDIDNKKFILNEHNMDNFFELYSDRFVFEEEDFEFDIDIKKNNNIYIFSQKNKYSQQDQEEYQNLKNNYFSKHFIDAEKTFIRKKFKISEKRIYRYDHKNKKFLYMNINTYERNLLEKLFVKNLSLDKDKFYDVISFFKDKIENLKISDDYDDLIENFIIEKPKIYLDINLEGELIFKLKYKSNIVNSNLKQFMEVFDYLNFEISSSFNKVLEEASYNTSENIDINETFIITKKDEFDRLVEEVIPLLYDYSEIFLSQALKNFNKPKRLSYSVGIKVNSNFLELNLSSNDLEKGEILDLLAHYRAKKKYYRMKKGEVILIDKEQMEFLDGFIKDLNIKESELKNENIKIPTFRAYQLEKLENNFIDIEKDKNFDSIFSSKINKISEKYKDILRDYQTHGVEWLLKLREMNLGGILADDMGLGKTLQVIAYLESVDLNAPCLIVTPTSLILNWENEFKKFDSNLKIISIHGSKASREKLLEDVKNKIVITSYDYLKRDIELYEKIEFDTIILDEAQYIKNHKTKIAQTVKKIFSKYKIALTGTPIENTLAELWSIFDFLMRGYLFHYEYFYKYYERAIVLEEDEKVVERLKKMVEPFILRRLKRDVLTELPEKIEETFFINLSEDEKNLYQANLIKINEILAQNIGSNNKIEVLAILTKLRQLCIDPRLVYENTSNSSSKIKSCMQLILKSIDNKEKILLFSSFTSVLDIISEECDKLSIPYFTLTGSTNKTKRKELVDEFQDGRVPLFLISLKAGGTGLNLTKASVVIHIDPWWNISAQNQATDRAYRIGQENTVQVFNLITKNTIEEKILNLQGKKKELSDIFVEDSKGSFPTLTREELLDLFKIE